MEAPGDVDSCLQWSGPPPRSLSEPKKSLSATWCMKAHCLLIQLYMTPDPVCTDAIWPSCHHPFRPVEEIQWIFIMLHVYVTRFASFLLILIAANVSWKYITWRCCTIAEEKKKRELQSYALSLGKNIQKICTAQAVHMEFICFL